MKGTDINKYARIDSSLFSHICLYNKNLCLATSLSSKLSTGDGSGNSNIE